MDDTLIEITKVTIKDLCLSHDKLEQRCLQDDVSPEVKTQAGKTLTLYRGEIERLLLSLPVDERGYVSEHVMLTFNEDLCVLLPGIAEAPACEIPNTHLQRLLKDGPGLLDAYLERGLTPPRDTEDFEEFLVTLLARCIPEEAHDWRDVTYRFLIRQERPLTTYLWYIRECAGKLPVTLSVFLSRLVGDCVRAAPTHASSALRAAIIGSCTFDAACLLIAGTAMPDDYSALRSPGRKVTALLEACSSHHGLMAMIATHGPLTAYIAGGEAPDYASIAA